MHNVPHFPDFRRVTLADKDWYSTFIQAFEPYADFSFGNFIVWLNQRDDLAICQLNGNLIVHCTAVFMNNQLIITLIGRNQISETINAIFKHQQEHGLAIELLGVPDVVVNSLGKQVSDYEITTDRDEFEYVYRTDRLASLEGSEYRNKRRDLSIFKRSNPDTELRELDLADITTCDYLRKCLRTWENTYSANDPTQQEAEVLESTLKFGGQLAYKNYSLYINDDLVGFVLYQAPPGADCVIVNHIKTDNKIPYTFDYLFVALANKLHSEGIHWINLEQDLGLPGLRAHKESLRPDHFLEKYTIRPR